MLVLSRKLLQKIKIGENIVVTIVGNRKTVRIGIEAPPEVKVLRGELCGLADALPDAPEPVEVEAEAPPEPEFDPTPLGWQFQPMVRSR